MKKKNDLFADYKKWLEEFILYQNEHGGRIIPDSDQNIYYNNEQCRPDDKNDSGQILNM